jgi:hypothetical protein
VRRFLAEQDGEERDMAAFVEKVVRRELFDQKLQAIKNRNAQYSQQNIRQYVSAVSRITRIFSSKFIFYNPNLG